eukprot:gene7963-biopygen21105
MSHVFKKITSGSKRPGNLAFAPRSGPHAARAPGAQMIRMPAGRSPASQRLFGAHFSHFLASGVYRGGPAPGPLKFGKEQHHTIAGAMMWWTGPNDVSQQSRQLHRFLSHRVEVQHSPLVSRPVSTVRCVRHSQRGTPDCNVHDCCHLLRVQTALGWCQSKDNTINPVLAIIHSDQHWSPRSIWIFRMQMDQYSSAQMNTGQHGAARNTRINTDHGSVRINTDQRGLIRINTDQHGSTRLLPEGRHYFGFARPSPVRRSFSQEQPFPVGRGNVHCTVQGPAVQV